MGTTPLALLPIPDLTDAANVPSSFSTFGAAAEKLMVMRFATTAARDAAITVPEEGMVVYLLDSNTLTVYSGAAWSTIGPAHGALTSWVPAVVQGATPTLTVNFAQYSRVGRAVSGQFFVSLTAAGTAANVVQITLPVAAANNVGSLIGFATLADLSLSLQYDGGLIVGSSTTMLIRSGTTAIDAYLGSTNFTAALASGDTIRGFFQYTAAADA